MRKSTRTAVVVRQAKREANRAALQATMRVSFNSIVFWLYPKIVFVFVIYIDFLLH